MYVELHKKRGKCYQHSPRLCITNSPYDTHLYSDYISRQRRKQECSGRQVIQADFFGGLGKRPTQKNLACSRDWRLSSGVHQGIPGVTP